MTLTGKTATERCADHIRKVMESVGPEYLGTIDFNKILDEFRGIRIGRQKIEVLTRLLGQEMADTVRITLINALANLPLVPRYILKIIESLEGRPSDIYDSVRILLQARIRREQTKRDVSKGPAKDHRVSKKAPPHPHI